MFCTESYLPSFVFVAPVSRCVGRNYFLFLGVETLSGRHLLWVLKFKFKSNQLKSQGLLSAQEEGIREQLLLPHPDHSQRLPAQAREPDLAKITI